MLLCLIFGFGRRRNRRRPVHCCPIPHIRLFVNVYMNATNMARIWTKSRVVLLTANIADKLFLFFLLLRLLFAKSKCFCTPPHSRLISLLLLAFCSKCSIYFLIVVCFFYTKIACYRRRRRRKKSKPT